LLTTSVAEGLAVDVSEMMREPLRAWRWPREDGEQVLSVGDLLLRDEDNASSMLHFTCPRDRSRSRREVAAVELHALDDLRSTVSALWPSTA
jgi:hypothetical protein